MAPADNTPDFDSMSPEEIMAWMETLAKRQGVKSEELTTAADVDIPEIDPNTVVIDEPGYVPYGEERPPKPAAPAPLPTASAPPPVRQEPPAAAKPAESSFPAQPAQRPTDSSFPAQPQTQRPSESPFPPPTQAPRPFSAPPPRPSAQSSEEQGPTRPITPMSPRPSAPPSGMNPLRPPSTPPSRPMPTTPSTPPRPTPDFSARPATPSTPNTASEPPRTTPDFTARPAAQTPAQTPSAAPDTARTTSDFSPRPVTPAPQPPTPRPAPSNPRTAFEPPKWLTTRPLSSPPAAPSTPAASTPSAPATPPPAPVTPPPAPVVQSKPIPEPATTNEDTDAMKWLESLAADQGDSMFNLDLSSLMDPPELEDDSSSSLDPVAFLQDLAGTNADDDATAIFARIEPPKSAEPEPVKAAEPVASTEADGDVPTVADPFDAGVDPIAWLENLARRQGASSEELTTDVTMDIPVPENPVIDEPGYNPFSFDSPVERHAPTRADSPFTLDNDSDWPEAEPAAPAAGTSSDDVSAIERSINAGTVSPEDMQKYLEHQTDKYVDSLGSDTDEDDEDALVPAELPDWLLEQVGGGPSSNVLLDEDDEEEEAETPLVPDVFADMPEWLRDDADQADAVSLLGIFDDLPEQEDSQTLKTDPDFAGFTIEIDRSDPWVEAFEAEQEEGLPSITELPEWYVQNLNDPGRVAAVDQVVNAPALADAALPIETELKPGTPIDVPSWLAPQEEEPALVSELPDWLLELEASDVAVQAEEIPDWLNEDSDTIEELLPDTLPPVIPAAVIAPEPVRAVPPTPVQPVQPVQPAQPVQPKPQPAAAAPALRPAASVAAADLQTARDHASRGDVETSVAHYEALIRINHELEAVVDDLMRLSKVHRANPAVHRVLGDGLMRQGKLQAALDVYREALNQL